jgi:hypothetical protein
MLSKTEIHQADRTGELGFCPLCEMFFRAGYEYREERRKIEYYKRLLSFCLDCYKNRRRECINREMAIAYKNGKYDSPAAYAKSKLLKRGVSKETISANPDLILVEQRLDAVRSLLRDVRNGKIYIND